MIDRPPPPDAVAWHKSSFSNSGGCVETGETADHVWLRDSKDRSGPVLGFSRFEWEAFVAGVKAGEFG